MAEAFCGCRGPVIDNAFHYWKRGGRMNLIKLLAHVEEIVLRLPVET